MTSPFPLLLLASVIHGLQIPCFLEFDAACNVVPFSYCDAEAQECKCLPKYKEKLHHCLPELDAYCDRPGYPCGGKENSVCGANYRCECGRGFEQKDHDCVPKSKPPLPERFYGSVSSIQGNLATPPYSSFDLTPPEQQSFADIHELQSQLTNFPGSVIGHLDESARGLLLRALFKNDNFRSALLRQYLFAKRKPENSASLGNLAGIIQTAEKIIRPGTSDGGGILETFGGDLFGNGVAKYKNLDLPPSSSITIAPITIEFGGVCRSSMQCSLKTPHSVCYDGRCVCPPNYIENIGACFPGLGTSCNAEQPCFKRYSFCGQNGVCECQKTFRPVNGECAPGLGSECGLIGQPCHGIASAVCESDHLCTCAPGYRQEGEECARVQGVRTSPLGSSCEERECKVAGAYCNENDRCTCLPGYRPHEGMCLPSLQRQSPCTTDLHCTVRDENAKCVGGACSCSEGFRKILGKCYPVLGSPCSDRLPCGVLNSHCSPNFHKCLCKESAMEQNGKCILFHLNDPGEITAIAVEKTSSKECDRVGTSCPGMSNTICDHFFNCVCRQGYISSGREGCVPATSQNSWQPEGLADFSGLLDHETKNMISETKPSPAGLVLKDTQCSEVGRPCVGILNSLCTAEGICICVPGHVRTASGCKAVTLSNTQQPAPTKVGNSCERGKCEHGRNAVCRADGTCVCKQGFVPVAGSCYPGLGHLCSALDWCGVPNSVCSQSGTCTCRNGFTQHLHSCLHSSTRAKPRRLECWMPGQACLTIANAICTENNQCKCIAGYQRVEQRCLLLSSSEDSTECPTGFVRIGSQCLPGVLIGYSCHATVQCELISEGSECQEGKCMCKQGFLAYNATTCLRVKALGESCQMSRECGAVNSECGMGLCVCRPHYIPILGLCFAGIGSPCSSGSDRAFMKCGDAKSFCNSEGLCQCRHGPLPDGKCR